MNTRKLIGLLCWLFAFAIPARYGIIETEKVVKADGSADNITGLIAFVVFIVLVFTGYFLVDGSGSKKAQGQGH